MRVSNPREYGLRAMINLAEAQKNSPTGMVQIREISAREQIPPKFLEQILLALKNAGIVHSKMGSITAIIWREHRRKLRSGRSCVRLTVRWRQSNVFRKWHMNRAVALTKRVVACAW